MAVTKRLRFEILRRDNHSCRYCGATAPTVKLTVDHVTPSALGGSDTPDNLVTACEPCNSGKSSVSPDSDTVAGVAQDQLRWATAMKQAAAELEAEELPKLQYREAFERAWNAWTYEHKGQAVTHGLPNDWRSSVERYRLSGLPASMWPDIVEPAMTNPMVKAESLFRYTCGVANKRLEELHLRARTISRPASTTRATEPHALVTALTTLWAAVWESDFGQAPTAAEISEFRESLAEPLQDEDQDLQRLASAAVAGPMFGHTGLQECLDMLTHEERTDVVMKWSNAWFATAGEFPNSDLLVVVDRQCKALIAGGVDVARLLIPAVAAGVRLSTDLHVGLSDAELNLTEVVRWRRRAEELWAEAFLGAAMRWPAPAERAAFEASLLRILGDSNFLISDVYAAASAAGAYQDADMSTCLPRNASAFEAAASPLFTSLA